MSIAQRRYSQAEIDDLIVCPKVFSEAPRREMKLNRGHFKSDVRVKSVDEIWSSVCSCVAARTYRRIFP